MTEHELRHATRATREAARAFAASSKANQQRQQEEDYRQQHHQREQQVEQVLYEEEEESDELDEEPPMEVDETVESAFSTSTSEIDLLNSPYLSPWTSQGKPSLVLLPFPESKLTPLHSHVQVPSKRLPLVNNNKQRPLLLLPLNPFAKPLSLLPRHREDPLVTLRPRRKLPSPFPLTLPLRRSLLHRTNPTRPRTTANRSSLRLRKNSLVTNKRSLLLLLPSLPELVVVVLRSSLLLVLTVASLPPILLHPRRATLRLNLLPRLDLSRSLKHKLPRLLHLSVSTWATRFESPVRTNTESSLLTSTTTRSRSTTTPHLLDTPLPLLNHRTVRKPLTRLITPFSPTGPTPLRLNKQVTMSFPFLLQ